MEQIQADVALGEPLHDIPYHITSSVDLYAGTGDRVQVAAHDGLGLLVHSDEVFRILGGALGCTSDVNHQILVPSI